MKKLGVNIDHVATVRQARGGVHPSPRSAALEAVKGGADGITVHLREDRRHIQDRDVFEIKKAVRVPLNLEMAVVPDIVKIALEICPEKVCLVPERRLELTTEGGLDVCAAETSLTEVIARFHQREIEVSLFVDPDEKQVKAASRAGADAVEIHTGRFANAKGVEKNKELARIRKSAHQAAELGLNVHAGHGLDYQNIGRIVRIPEIQEFNIGHSIVSQALFTGMKNAVREMKRLIIRFS